MNPQSTGTGWGPNSSGSNGISKRSRIVNESIDANRNNKRRTTQKQGQSKARWTRIKYEGYQSTLDLGEDLKPIRAAKTLTRPLAKPPAIGSDIMIDHDEDIRCKDSDSSFLESDPIMLELNEMLQNSSDPVVGSCEIDKDVHKPTAKPSSTPSTFSQYGSPFRSSRWPELLLQPDSRPIAQEQLAAEVKSIYAGLTMVESKCISIDAAQARDARVKNSERSWNTSSEHWRALLALHRTLLHEHHDFYLASHHPSASPALKHLAMKYSMPTRMWRHGIESFLKLIRPSVMGNDKAELETMIAFLAHSQQVIGSLQDNLPSMTDEWTKMEDALREYELLIRNLVAKPEDKWEHQSPDLCPTGSAEASMGLQYDDLYCREYGAFTATLPTSNPLDHGPWLPQFITQTLGGWLYYGQAIADNFSTYTKVFAALSLVAQQCCSSFLYLNLFYQILD